MSDQPPANSFRAAVLSGRAGRNDDLVVRDKHGRCAEADDLASVEVPRSESRRGNHRNRDRHRLSGEVATVRYDGRDLPVELINLSAGGAMVRGEIGAALWDHVGLVLGDEDEIDCAVRWIKGGQVGLEFAHETRIECDDRSHDELLRAVIRKSFPDLARDPLAEPPEPVTARHDREAEAAQVDPESEQRSARRHPLIWSGTIYRDSSNPETARLRNISQSGALVQCESQLRVGEEIFLDLGAAGQLEAAVRWTRGNQAGLDFAEPFDVQSLANSEPDIAASEPEPAFGDQQAKAWAPGWRRPTIDELARDLG